MNIDQSPEPLLLELISIDGDRLGGVTLHWVKEFLGAGECALAYDGLSFEVLNGNYVPSERAWYLLKSAAFMLQLPFPTRKT